MSDFPRTTVDSLSVSRLVIGTNWFLGWSHQSQAKDNLIRNSMGRRQIADILEVFFRAGVDTVLGIRPEATHLAEAIQDAQDRTGRAAIAISTPGMNITDAPHAIDDTARELDLHAAMGTHICMPHQSATDALLDRRRRCITNMDRYVAMIRQRGMIPGLSTHMPETPVYADETDLDVATYIQIYNAAGFLMQIEVDWVHQMIWDRRKPVLTIKPLAAGRVPPLVGLAFSWATIRDIDMVSVGTMTPDEAREVVELSLSLLERRRGRIQLQKTRSKDSVLPRRPAKTPDQPNDSPRP